MIYTIGETVLDIITKNLDQVYMRPGGSMLNTAISLGRLRVHVEHISMLSTDHASQLLIEFLGNNGVGTNFIFRNDQLKTNLALAFLDENNNASYSFYKDKNIESPNLIFPLTSKNDFLLFGSFFSINHLIYNQLKVFLENSAQQNTLLMYDPNFRKPHVPELPQLQSMIETNFSYAHLVKASDEDLENIFEIKDSEQAWQKMQEFGVSTLIYTMGKNGTWVITKTVKLFVPSETVKTLSTIGAGDTFSAGILFYFYKLGIDANTLPEISEEEWKKCLQFAHKLAAFTCQSYDNYISPEQAKSMNHV